MRMSDSKLFGHFLQFLRGGKVKFLSGIFRNMHLSDEIGTGIKIGIQAISCKHSNF